MYIQSKHNYKVYIFCTREDNNMNDIMVTFRTEKNVKEGASKIFEELGINLSTAINIFLKQTILKQKFPLELEVDRNITKAEDTYPKGYFDLFGSCKDLDLVEVDDIDVKLDGGIDL